MTLSRGAHNVSLVHPARVPGRRRRLRHTDRTSTGRTAGRKARESPEPTVGVVLFTTLTGRTRLVAAVVVTLTLSTPFVAAGAAPTSTEPAATSLAPVIDDQTDLRDITRQIQQHRRAVYVAEQAAAAAVLAHKQAAAAAEADAAARRTAPTRANRHVARPDSRRPARTPATTIVLPVNAGRSAAVVAFALSQVGKPYRWGAVGPNAYDCSGLLVAAFAQVGRRLPHQSGAIAALGRYVPRGQWQAGDVLHSPGHIGLYIGGGRMVHAPRPGKTVSVVRVYGPFTAYRL